MSGAQDAAFVAVIVILLLVESWWSRLNERQLRLLGAREPADDVYRWMQVAYPASFGLMIAEGLLAPSGGMPVWGALGFAAAKGLKYLGHRVAGFPLVLPRAGAARFRAGRARTVPVDRPSQLRCRGARVAGGRRLLRSMAHGAAMLDRIRVVDVEASPRRGTGAGRRSYPVTAPVFRQRAAQGAGIGAGAFPGATVLRVSSSKPP